MLRGGPLGCKQTQTSTPIRANPLVKKPIQVNRLGDALRAARKTAQMTQEELSKEAGTPRLAVIRAEAGEGLLSPFERLLLPLETMIDGRNLPAGPDIGSRLGELRLARGLSQTKIAEAAKLSRPTVAKIEGGEPGHLVAIERLGAALGAGLAVIPLAAPPSYWTSIAARSLDQKWTTPPALLDRLYEALGVFDLDPCSPRKDGPVRAKIRFTLEDDGLALPWPEGLTFVNPPYGPLLRQWMTKCRQEAHQRHGIIVALIPARTDTRWWHDSIAGQADLFMLKGRLSFGDGAAPAPFPSALVVWNAEPDQIAKLRFVFPDAWFVPRTTTFTPTG